MARTEADEEESGEEPEEPEAEADAEEPEAEDGRRGRRRRPPAEPVAATGAVQKMARKHRRPAPSPETEPERPNGVLVAAGGYQAGQPVTDRLELGEMMGEQADAQVRQNSLEQKVVVASARFEYPEDRKLGANAEENTRKIDAVCGPQAMAYNPITGEPLGTSLVATGGICAPVNVDYSVPTWATAERPIRDGLASFEATRGGIVFVQPPDIAEWEAATAVWTEATDAEPAGQTKPVKVLACGTEEKVFVEAVSTRIGFGNMQARFAPEQVAANTDLAIAGGGSCRRGKPAEQNRSGVDEETRNGEARSAPPVTSSARSRSGSRPTGTSTASRRPSRSPRSCR